MEEAKLHNLIQEELSVQNSLKSLLNANSNAKFVHEDQYPNGLYADFTLLEGNNVKAIIECKGSEIGVNDYVRGIGQVMQYQHFIDDRMSIKDYDFYTDACSVYLFPSSIVRSKSFNIGLFRYPDKCKIVEINEINHNLRIITEDELKRLAEASKKDMITISPYYIRDNRLYELYICLKYCQYRKFIGIDKINRGDTEKNILSKLGTPNNRNWRNAFIGLSSLGLIDSNNIPNSKGTIYGTIDYSEFVYEIYNSYIKEYVDLIINVLIERKKKLNNDNEYFEISNSELSEEIGEKTKGRKVLFLTDSDNRYISSWLNIMRDDLQCIDFETRATQRKINYVPSQLTKEAMINKIRCNDLAYQYISKLNEFLKG